MFNGIRARLGLSSDPILYQLIRAVFPRLDYYVGRQVFPPSAPAVAARSYRQGAFRELELKLGAVLVQVSCATR